MFKKRRPTVISAAARRLPNNMTVMELQEIAPLIKLYRSGNKELKELLEAVKRQPTDDGPKTRAPAGAARVTATQPVQGWTEMVRNGKPRAQPLGPAAPAAPRVIKSDLP